MKSKQEPLIERARITILFFLVGILSLLASVVQGSSALSIIGLGLVFWGAVFSYIKTKEYVKKSVFDASQFTLYPTLGLLISELKFYGREVYLPPKYSVDPDECKLFVLKQKNGQIPTPEEVLEQEEQCVIASNKGLLITAPGAELMKLFERTLAASFTELKLSQVRHHLPRIIVENLEIAQAVEVENEDDEGVCITIEGSIYGDVWDNAAQQSTVPYSSNYLLISAFACMLARVSGKPVSLDDIFVSEDGKKARLRFHLFE